MAFPDVCLAGAMRCGTTKIHTCFIYHPELSPYQPEGRSVYQKESHYFSFKYRDVPYKNYCKCFKKKKGSLTYDPSVDCFHIPGAETRIFEASPKCKLIFCIRNPTNRAWSHYWWEAIRNKSEGLYFMDAIKRQPKPGNEKEMNLKYFFYSYLEIGHYAEHLKRWSKKFSPDQMLIVCSEKLWDNFQYGFNQICDFLEITKYDLDAEERGIKSKIIKGQLKGDEQERPFVSNSIHVIAKKAGLKIPDPHPAIKEYLDEYYWDRNEELYELIGDDLGWNTI